MMKYLISESRLNDFIYEYLTKNYHPDYNWGPELHDFYKKDVENHGWYDFDINDTGAYTYLGPAGIYKDNEKNTLLIQSWVVDKLNELFGDKWVSVFIEWFEDNSGLSVKHVKLM